MALVKCPDCGKLVSERASVCPDCGCPKEYFQKTEKIEKEIAKAENPIKEVEELVFVFGPMRMKYPKTVTKFASMFGDYRKIADTALEEALLKYTSAGTLENAIGTLRKFANEKINEVVSKSIKLLYDNNVYYTNKQFINKYSIDYEPYLESAKDQCQNVVQMKQELQAYRSAEKASRGRWQGGGFGLKGAIKGAATAGMLNMGSDFLHSFGDAAQERRDNVAVQNKFDAIYRNENTKWNICSGLYNCIIEVYDALVQELKKINYFEDFIKFDEKQEYAKYTATMEHANDDNEKFKHLVECLGLFPGDKRVTDALIPILISFEQDEFGEWLEFWHLEYRYPTYKEQRKAASEFDRFLAKKGIELFAFNNVNVEQYLQLRKWIYEYYEKYKVTQMPEYSFFARAIKEYYSHIHATMTWYAIIEWVPQECNIYQFMTYMRMEREGLVNSVLPDFWLYGDSEAVLPEKILDIAFNDKTKILMFYDNSMFGNGTKGIMITTEYVYDLKSKIKLPLKDIDDVILYDDDSMGIAIGKQKINFKDYILEDEDAANHLAKLIRVLCVRYAGNIKLWSEKMSTPKPNGNVQENKLSKEEDNSETVNTIVESNVQSELEMYIMENFTNDKKVQAVAYYRQQTGLGLKEAKDKVDEILSHSDRRTIEATGLDGGMIFCTNCGKQINRNVKFCNFCGTPNKYC